MARKVKRKATGVRRAANSRSRASKARAAHRQSKGVVNSALSALPISQQQLQGTFLILILAGALAAAWFVASAAGVPALMSQQVATSAGAAGFQMRNIDLTGVERMNRLKVYEEVMEHRGTPMPLLDLAAIRADPKQMPWVAEARVSRQLPDKLVIDIQERTPHAVLVKPDRLVLIDRNGVELDPIGDGGFGLTAEDFGLLTRIVLDTTDRPIVSMLEGGYSLSGLPLCIEQHLSFLHNR